MLLGAAALQEDGVAVGVWCWFGASASHTALQQLHSGLHWLHCLCFSKASNNSLKRVLKGLMVVHTPGLDPQEKYP